MIIFPGVILGFGQLELGSIGLDYTMVGFPDKPSMTWTIIEEPDGGEITAFFVDK